MLQRVLHEGSQVVEGIKYAFRCDVIYEKRIENINDILKELSPQEQGNKLLKLAEFLESSKKCSLVAATDYYARGQKILDRIK